VIGLPSFFDCAEIPDKPEMEEEESMNEGPPPPEEEQMVAEEAPGQE
jgi:hypothetical protein